MRAQQARGAAGGAADAKGDAGSAGADLKRMAQMKRAQQRKKAAAKDGDEKEAAPAQESPMMAMSSAIQLIQNQVLPEWNQACDSLDPGRVKTAGALAIGAWNDVLITSSTAEGSPEGPGIEMLKQTAIGLIGELGLRKVQGKPLPVPEGELPHDPLKFIEQTTARVSFQVERARNIFRLLKAAPRDEKGKPGMPDDDASADIFRELGAFQNDDFLWLEAVASLQGNALDQLINMKGMAGAEFQEQSHEADQHRDLTNDGKQPMEPEEEKRINDAANKIQELVEGTETADYEALDPYLQILRELTPEERTNLFYILQSRGLIHDMAHLGSDGVLKLIRETPQWTNYQINDACRTHLTRTERLEDAAVETARQFPGAMMSLGQGFVGGLGNIPIVGGAFDYAADKIGEARDWTNKKMGADPHIASMMKHVEGGIGNAGAVGVEVMAGGEVSEVEGMEAAATGTKVLEAYDIYKDASVLHRVYSAISGLRTAWDEAPKIWHEAEPILHQFVHLDLAGVFSGDEAKIDAVDKLLDTGIDSLEKLGGEKFTEKGAKEAKEEEEAPEERRKAEEQTQNPALMGEVKKLEFLQSKAVLADATPEEKEEFKQQAQKVELMMKQQANPDIAAGKAALEKEEDAKKAAAAKAVQKGDPDFKSLGHELLEKLKEVVIGTLGGALKGFKKGFIEPLKKAAKDGPVKKEQQKSLLDEGIRGAIEGFSEAFWEPGVEGLTELAEAGIEAAVKEWLPAASGITKVSEVHDEIEKLVKWGVEKLNIQDGMAHMLEKTFNVEDPEEAEKEKLEEGESPEKRLEAAAGVED
jgi:hypothetical protein